MEWRGNNILFGATWQTVHKPFLRRPRLELLTSLLWSAIFIASTPASCVKKRTVVCVVKMPGTN